MEHAHGPATSPAAEANADGTRPRRDAPAYSEAQVLIAAPPDSVWRLLADIDGWPRWNPHVERATLQGPVARGTVFRWRSRGLAVTSTIQVAVECRRLAWTGRAFGTHAIHDWDLETAPGGTLLRTAESFSGWLPRLMPRAMQRTLDQALPAWLGALKAEAERRNQRGGAA